MSIFTKLFKRSGNDNDSVMISALSTDMVGAMENFKSSNRLPYEKFDKLYKIDPLVFRSVWEYVSGIGSGYSIKGGIDEERKSLEKWFDSNGIFFMVQDAIRDIVLYGNFFAIFEKTNKELRLIPLSSKCMDVIRDSNGVELSDHGRPLGYVFEYNGVKTQIKKNEIMVGDEVIESSKTEDFRDNIVHFKLWTTGDSFLGITPLLAVYNSAIIRLNLSDSIGESAFRSGGLYAKIKGKIPEKDRKELENALKNSTTKNIFVMEDKIDLSTVPVADMQSRDKLVYYYADEVAAGMGVPLSLMMSGGAGYSGERDLKITKWEQSIKPLQLRLAYQIREQIFKKYYHVNKFSNELPEFVFAQNTPFLKLNQSRTVSTYARRGLIKRDPELEMELRRELGLPISEFLEEEKKAWKQNYKKNDWFGTEIDIKSEQ